MAINLQTTLKGYSITITIDVEDYATYPIYLIDPPEVSYNADNYDNENLFFPSNLKISFYCPNDIFYFLSEYTIIQIQSGNETIFFGKLDYESIQYEPENKNYTLTFVDRSTEWIEKSYQDFPQYIGNNNVTSIISLLTNITGLSIIHNYPSNFVTLRTAQTFPLNNNQPYVAGIGRWGTYPSYFFDGNYQTAGDIIKAILNSVGLLGYVQGNNLILCNKFTFANQINLNPYNIIDLEYSKTLAYDYVISSIRIGPTARYDYIYDQRINQLLNPKKQITLKFELLVGTRPDNPDLSFSNVWIDVPGYIYPPSGGWFIADFNSATFGSGYKSLWRLLSDALVERLIINRDEIKLRYKGDVKLFDKISLNGDKYLVNYILKKLGEDIVKCKGLKIVSK